MVLLLIASILSLFQLKCGIFFQSLILFICIFKLQREIYEFIAYDLFLNSIISTKVAVFTSYHIE